MSRAAASTCIATIAQHFLPEVDVLLLLAHGRLDGAHRERCGALLAEHLGITVLPRHLEGLEECARPMRIDRPADRDFVHGHLPQDLHERHRHVEGHGVELDRLRVDVVVLADVVEVAAAVVLDHAVHHVAQLVDGLDEHVVVEVVHRRDAEAERQLGEELSADELYGLVVLDVDRTAPLFLVVAHGPFLVSLTSA